jgi:hypothetical protein
MVTGGIVCFVGAVMAVVCLLLPTPENETAIWHGGLACALMFGIVLFLLGCIFLTFGIVESTVASAERAMLERGGSRGDDDDDEDDEDDEYEDDD